MLLQKSVGYFEKLKLSRSGIHLNDGEPLERTANSEIWVGIFTQTPDPVVVKRSQHKLAWTFQPKRFPWLFRFRIHENLARLEQTEKEHRYQSMVKSPFVFSVLGHVASWNFFYLVLPMAPFGDLQKFLRRSSEWVSKATVVSHDMDNLVFNPRKQDHFFVFEVAIYFMTPIFLALEALHELGIVHLDVKLPNILIAEGLVPKLSDFGAAKKLPSADGSGKIEKDEVFGTRLYVSPEIVLKDEFSTASDVFSLGMSLALCVTGDLDASCAKRLRWDKKTLYGLENKYEQVYDDSTVPQLVAMRRGVVHRILGIAVGYENGSGFFPPHTFASWWQEDLPYERRSIAENYLLLGEKLLSIWPAERASVKEALSTKFLSEYVLMWTSEEEEHAKKLRSIRDEIAQSFDAEKVLPA